MRAVTPSQLLRAVETRDGRERERRAAPRWDHARELRAARRPSATVAPPGPPLRDEGRGPGPGWARLVAVGVVLVAAAGTWLGVSASVAPASASHVLERSAPGIDPVAEASSGSLRALEGALVACHDATVDAPEELTAHVAVEASGAVGACSITPPSGPSEDVLACLRARTDGLAFGPLAGGSAALVRLRVGR